MIVFQAGTENIFWSIFSFVNTLNHDLKFTMEIEGKSIYFLDLKISIVNVKFETNVYSKPTGSQLNLHVNSCHKPSSIMGTQKAVAFLPSTIMWD